MKATQAKFLSEQAKGERPDVVGILVRRCHERIEAAARRGEHQVVDPLKGLRMTVRPEQASAVWEQLRRDGYRISNDGRNGDELFIHW